MTTPVDTGVKLKWPIAGTRSRHAALSLRERVLPAVPTLRARGPLARPHPLEAVLELGVVPAGAGWK